MPTAANPTAATIALLGNPNTGKSTLFSALAGVRQRTGNYPGVTVEKKIGHLTHEGCRLSLVDLPGTYSLAPRSPDEMVAVDVLLGRQAGTPQPDAVLCIVDASNLERNLYLVSQVLELGLPTVLALNMVDVARNQQITLDVEQLRQRLGIPIVEVQANRGVGVGSLKSALVAAVATSGRPPKSPFPPAFCAEVQRLEEVIAEQRRQQGKAAAPLPRYLVERLLLDTSGYLEQHEAAQGQAAVHEQIAAARARLAEAGLPVPAVEAVARYGWVGELLQGVVSRPDVRRRSASDRLDGVLTHPLVGTLLFLLLMVVMFQAVFSWAAPAMELIDGGVASLGDWVSGLLAEGPLQSLIVDGLIAGVGGVLVFLPQILILFFFIGVLEDCGYMARAAYLMDKLMAPIGLSGKSFIPMLSSFACAIPGVMATRVIENYRDRLTTILVAPLMSCSARLPVYVLLIAAFVPPRYFLAGWFSLQALTMAAMYLLGIVVAAGVAFTLKRTLLRGPTPPFVLELPAYKWPSARIVLFRMLDRGWSFVRRAGTLIVAVSIVVWAALYYPRLPEADRTAWETQQQAIESQLAALPEDSANRAALEAQLADLQHTVDGAQKRQSYLGRAGRVIEPVVRPLGWDWRIGAAAIASFPAREVVVATLGIIFNVGAEIDIEDEQQRSQLIEPLRAATWDGTDRPLFNLPVALSLMVFFALCAQCAATLAVIRRETNSWFWPVFTFTYMTVLAYVGALVTYQVGTALL